MNAPGSCARAAFETQGSVMKTVTLCLSLSILLALLTGCITPNVSALSTQSLLRPTSSVNPALAGAVKGLHPYVSASFSDKSGTLDREESIEDFKVGTVTVGLNYHESLEDRIEFAPFLGGSISGSVVSYNPQFLDEEYEAIRARSIDVDGDIIDYSAEILVKPGFLLKLRKVLMSAYFIGVCRYENGEYASLRRDLDGVEQMYNLADNDWSYGCGLGYDIQFGTPDSFDVGLVWEMTTMFNRTQSVSSEYLMGSDVPALVPGGDEYSQLSLTFGPYFDYRHWRISVTKGISDISTVKVVWRL